MSSNGISIDDFLIFFIVYSGKSSFYCFFESMLFGLVVKFSVGLLFHPRQIVDLGVVDDFVHLHLAMKPNSVLDRYLTLTPLFSIR